MNSASASLKKRELSCILPRKVLYLLATLLHSVGAYCAAYLIK